MTMPTTVPAQDKASTSSLPAVAGGKPAKTTPFATEPRYGADELAELKEALDQGSLFYAHGKKVHALESEFAAAAGLEYGVATSSGTATIHTALMACGLSPGDEVIVPPITDMGSIGPVLWQGGVPVFADLDPHTYNLDPASVEKCVTPRTRAILVVHLAGNACDMDALVAIARKHNLLIIEDCAQAHGATYRGKHVGTFGSVGCFSYNEFKHISCGDGGVLVTNDESLAVKARLATDKGYSRDAKALVRSPTFLANNYRMTELQAAVARAQLRKLPSIVSRRRAWCAQLSRQLEGTPGLHLPKVTDGCDPSWWFYLVRVDTQRLGVSADEIAKALHAEGVPVGAHYIGTPIYLYPLFQQHSAYAHAGHPFASRDYRKGDCPVAESILHTCLMLGVKEAYSQADLDETVQAFRKVFEWYAASR